MEDGLTLEKAVSTARQQEYVKREQAALKQDDITGESIDRLWTKRPPYRPGGRKQDDALAPPTSTRAPHPTCMKCGRGPHSKYVCPTRAATCNKCHKVGHYGECCRNKAVREVSSECAQEEASAFLGAVGESKDDSNPWKVSLKLNSVPVELKIDTGAEVSVIPESVFKKLEGIALIPMSKTLYGPGGHVPFVSGKFTATLQLDKQEVREEMFVIPELKNALLGQPAIKSLNLLSRVCSVESDTAKIVADHPKLFDGLGSLEGEYRIELKPEAEPFALSAPRRVAITLMAKVKAELEEMERSGIISRVDQPTDWCSGMVVVPKSDGRVRICVDLSKLNESVKRNRHILPSVKQSLAQLGGATVFSKLDANSGFWQVKLHPESALFTTFITPYGRFCFNRLPFGITSAPEYFQKRMSTILNGSEGVVNQTDDTLVHGKNRAEHDRRLAAVLKRLEEADVTWNRGKCEFAKSSVKFLGHIVDAAGIRPD